MTEGSGTCVVLAAILFFTAMAYGQDSPLKAEIKTTQAVVKNIQDFVVSTKVENVGKEDQLLHIAECSYPEQWTADNPSVHVKQVFCKKNPLIDIRLKPGEALKGRWRSLYLFPPGSPWSHRLLISD